MNSVWLHDLRLSFRHPLLRVGLRIGLLLLVVDAALVAYRWPAATSHGQLVKQVDAAQTAIIDARQAVGVMDAYTRAREAIMTIGRKLDYATAQAKLIDDIADLARKYGVQVLSQEYDEASAGDKRQATLGVQLAAQGNYRALRNFIVGISSLPAWTEVSDVSIERGRDSGLLKAELRLLTYRRPNMADGPLPERQ
jgi:Tfp pilus assembly protein PilO